MRNYENSPIASESEDESRIIRPKTEDINVSVGLQKGRYFQLLLIVPQVISMSIVIGRVSQIMTRYLT